MYSQSNSEVSTTEGLGDGEAESLGEGDGEADGEAEPLGDGEDVGEDESLGEGDGDGEVESLGDGEGEADGEPLGDGEGVDETGGLKSENSPAVITIGTTVKLFPDLSRTSSAVTYIEKAKPVPGFKKLVGGANTVLVSHLALWLICIPAICPLNEPVPIVFGFPSLSNSVGCCLVGSSPAPISMSRPVVSKLANFVRPPPLGIIDSKCVVLTKFPFTNHE